MKEFALKKNLPWLILGALATVLISVNVIRVAEVSITHDEALTYQWYVTHSYADIITNHQPTANNHFLNSVLAKFSVELFTDNVFFLRLPSLLAHIGYLLFSILIARRLYTNAWWVLACFMVLQLNPFMFEFFGLSRGYGLSIACMMAAIIQLLKYKHTKTMRALIFMYVWLFLSVFSSLSMLNVVMAFTAVISVYGLAQYKDKMALRGGIAAIVLTALILLAIYEPVRILIERGQFYFGGETGFVQDTLKTLIGESLYLPEESKVGIYSGWVITLLIIITGIYWLAKVYREKDVTSTGVLLLLLLVIPALSTLTQHILFGNKYLIERTALFFYPLFALYITYTIAQARKTGKILISALLIVLSVNFFSNINLKSARTWEFDSYDKWLLDRMIALKKDDGEIKIYLDGYFTPAFRYRIPREYPEGTFGYIEGHNEKAYEWNEYDFCLIRKEEVHKIPTHFVLDTVVSRLEFHLYRQKD